MKPIINKKPGSTIPYLITVRIIFLVLAFYIGYNYQEYVNEYTVSEDRPFYGFVFLLVASIMVYIEMRAQMEYVQELVFGALGMIVGLFMATIISKTIIIDDTTQAARILHVGLHFFLGYFGAVIGLRHSSRFDFSGAGFFVPSDDRLRGCYVLDTSILIDGRILDIFKSGIFSGPIVVPRFVVNELQMLSDATDHRKRSKGRRGFDVLGQLQVDTVLSFELLEIDFPGVDGVDRKLITFCKLHEAALCTVDFNLCRIAELERVTAVNFNHLAQAMKQVIYAGDEYEVEIQREGKDEHQGVGYLDDGTMVVVDRGRKHLGQKVHVTVTTVLQTAAGHMVFASITDELPNGSASKKSRLPIAPPEREVVKTL